MSAGGGLDLDSTVFVGCLSVSSSLELELFCETMAPSGIAGMGS